MPKFRKKPIVIEADVFTWGMEDGIIKDRVFVPRDSAGSQYESTEFPGYNRIHHYNLVRRGFGEDDWKPYIQTLEGMMEIGEGDYIITGVKGERYPCKPDIFHMTYTEETTWEQVGNKAWWKDTVEPVTLDTILEEYRKTIPK